MEQTNKQENEAQELLEKWVKRLYLDDWTIQFYPKAQPNDFILRDVAGEAEYDEIGKSATIRILDPNFYGDRIVPFNFERILVHELLHLKFCFFDKSGNDLQDRVAHQLIEDLAKAFVN